MAFTRDQLNLIAEFRNLPKDRGRSASRHTHAFTDAITAALEKYNIGKETTEDLIMGEWKNIVGPQNAHRCKPQKILSGGTLTIETPNPMVRNELHFNQNQILSRIKAIPGCEHIKHIIFRAG